MASVVIAGDTSGSVSVTVPATAGSNTITLPAVTGTAVISGQNSAITAGTAVASTSGTSIDFTSIPSWVKRITILFNGVSTNGTSNPLIQIGDSGGIETTAYTSGGTFAPSGGTNYYTSSTVGFVIPAANAGAANSGIIQICNITSNTWIYSLSGCNTGESGASIAGGNKALSGTLDRVRITTVNGTDTFDAGTINILYE